MSSVLYPTNTRNAWLSGILSSLPILTSGRLHKSGSKCVRVVSQSLTTDDSMWSKSRSGNRVHLRKAASSMEGPHLHSISRNICVSAFQWLVSWALRDEQVLSWKLTFQRWQLSDYWLHSQGRTKGRPWQDWCTGPPQQKGPLNVFGPSRIQQGIASTWHMSPIDRWRYWVIDIKMRWRTSWNPGKLTQVIAARIAFAALMVGGRPDISMTHVRCPWIHTSIFHL